MSQEVEAMLPLESVLAQPIGAQFFRADMHVHSFGASHDVRDDAMTPANIVATAAREGISILSITDHNEVGNVEAALAASKNTGVLVVPGVEFSTPQGHLLCYLPTMESLTRLMGKVSIADRGTQNSRCQQSILECLNLLQELGGFGILAHVDVRSGFEQEVPGASPHKADVLCHGALLGIELKQGASPISYSDADEDPNRARIGQERISRLKLGTKQFLARVLNSDAHALDALGRNASNLKRVTRYKMDTPSFDGLRVALEDADARVRIEELIPQAVPRILGLHLDGGFLSGQSIQFSPNLNCIIGGRGTGKSTAFEAIRCLSGGGNQNKVIDSEVWPDELHLFWQDQAGQRHSLLRFKDGDLENMDSDPAAPNSFELDCFGQGEAARISYEAQADPLALLRYLDRFVDLKQAMIAEESAREQLLALQSEIEKAEQHVAQIPQFENLLGTTRKQLAALKKPDVKELIELQQQLATEREIRKQIAEKLQSAKDELKRGAPKATLRELRDLADPTGLTVGSAEFRAIRDGVIALEVSIAAADEQVSGGFSKLEAIVSTQMTSWKAKEADSQQKVDAKRRELEALNVTFDMSYITKLATDEASHQQSVNNLKLWKPHLNEQRRRRTAALKERWAARERVGELRSAFGQKASKTLREALSDLQVSLKYAKHAHSPEATNLIIETMGWRTNQQPRADWLVRDLTIPALLEAVEAKDAAPILSLQTPEGVPVFKADEVKLILERLSVPAIKFALERVKVHDLPRLHVSREISDGKGGIRHLVREFAKLSLGQQQSVLLALILSSDSNKPLIIDQPEDNLDGEFIYSTLVPVLRRAKERRQVIIVTHNSNVAVLGDAELVVVMKAMNDRGEIVERGSIDRAATRDAACAILEGAKEAFLRRAKMYGVKVRL